MTIASAYLCANCDHVTELRQGRCATCGSDAVLSLSKVLNRGNEIDYPGARES